MLAISSDSHDDNARLCLPLFLARVPAIFGFWATVVRALGPALQVFRMHRVLALARVLA